jgi:hypothetical protein
MPLAKVVAPLLIQQEVAPTSVHLRAQTCSVGLSTLLVTVRSTPSILPRPNQ